MDQENEKGAGLTRAVEKFQKIIKVIMDMAIRLTT
jgi:hypothetical protein